MSVETFRLEICRDLFQSQRSRRDEIRSSVATPVAALAFAIFDLSALATNVKLDDWTDPVTLGIAFLALLAVGAIFFGAILIIRVEWNFVYLDPPDLRELVEAERRLSAQFDEEETEAKLRTLMAGAYDIVYRRYFAGNEQAARDRTRGLRSFILSLCCLALAFLLLPLQ